MYITFIWLIIFTMFNIDQITHDWIENRKRGIGYRGDKSIFLIYYAFLIFNKHLKVIYHIYVVSMWQIELEKLCIIDENVRFPYRFNKHIKTKTSIDFVFSSYWRFRPCFVIKDLNSIYFIVRSVEWCTTIIINSMS